MSILNIKERFSKRILESEQETKEPVIKKNDTESVVESPTITSIQEVDVGISQYVSELPGFHAVIKQRYSDFNVHEIDRDGKITVLDSFELPDESLGAEALETTLISQDQLNELDRLVSNNNSTDIVTIDVTENSKEERRNIHQFVKAKYGDALTSNTADDDQKKLIKITRNEKGRKDNRRAGHLPKYLHFVLSKSNLDTTNALGLIGTKLRLKANNFNTAGTKDKRGNTTQWVSVKNVYAKQLRDIKNLRYVWMGNFVYKDHSLALGALNGNNFQIALREITASDELIEESLTKLKENGFVNYYGLQRFGNNPDSPTHEVGRQLVKEAFGPAVEMILKPRKTYNETPDMKAAREIYANTRDAGQALSALRNTRSIEAQLLQGLKKHGPNAYVNALDSIPRNVRLLYLHAYQSFIWNKVVSRRLAKYGKKVLEGDLVICEKEEKDAIEDEIVSEELEGEEPLDEKRKPRPVKEITAEEVDLYTIFDVALPLPGCNVVYPKNEQSEWYEELLAEDGLTKESFGCRVRKYALQGNYRKILKKPKNLSWKVVKYAKPEDDLILSDIDILEGKTLPEGEGNFRALIVSMDLSTSTYATMALREILRADTSASHQTLLNGHGHGQKRVSEIDGPENAETKKLKFDDVINEDALDE